VLIVIEDSGDDDDDDDDNDGNDNVYLSPPSANAFVSVNVARCQASLDAAIWFN
jgi:hypothetical protein